MTLLNTGSLMADKPFDEQAKAIIGEILGEPCDWFTLKEDALTFEDFPSGVLDMEISVMLC